MSKIPTKIHTCAQFYVVSINTGKVIEKNKTEKDKNVLKDAQGYVFCAHLGFIYLIKNRVKKIVIL